MPQWWLLRKSGTVMGATRNRYVPLDNNSTHPSAVDSVCGGDCMASTVFVADGLKLCD
jgi:hypothetical protein